MPVFREEKTERYYPMNRMKKTLAAFTLSMFLSLCLALPAALAAGSTEVWVNNVKLDASNPYWKNGNAPASAADWNAHFDAATATLTFQNAALDAVSPTYTAMVYAGADIRIVFQNHNTLAYNSALYSTVYGVHANGDITIDGDGSADFRITTNISNGQAAAIYGEGGLTILGGSLTMDVRAGFVAVGIRGFNGFLHAGGHMDVYTEASRSYAVFENNILFRMTGGSISATSVSTDELAHALSGSQLSLEGGEGVFRAYGPTSAYGLYFWERNLSYTGGRYLFAGDTSALFYSDIDSVVYTLTGGPVYATEAVSGSGKRLWISEAKDGRLESNLNETSSFKYVQFGEWPELPQTGDNARPWLWAGMGALCVLLMAVGIPAAAARKRNRIR